MIFDRLSPSARVLMMLIFLSLAGAVINNALWVLYVTRHPPGDDPIEWVGAILERIDRIDRRLSLLERK